MQVYEGFNHAICQFKKKKKNMQYVSFVNSDLHGFWIVYSVMGSV